MERAGRQTPDESNLRRNPFPMASATPPSPASPRLEIHNTRVFAAPPEKVYRAFADPKHLAQWWGPHGFTNTITAFEFKPGGAWRLTMHGPNGATYDNVSRFLEMQPSARIVFEHLEPMHWYLMTMTFAEEAPGQTRLTWRMEFERTAQNESIQGFITAANEENFDRLAAQLEKM